VFDVSCLSVIVQLSALHAVLYIVQVCTYKFKGKSHWYEITTTCFIITQKSAVLFYCVDEVTLKKQLYKEHDQSDIVCEYNGSLSCDRHIACT